MLTDVGTVDRQVSPTYMIVRVSPVAAIETALNRKVPEAGIGDHLGACSPTVDKVVTHYRQDLIRCGQGGAGFFS